MRKIGIEIKWENITSSTTSGFMSKRVCTAASVFVIPTCQSIKPQVIIPMWSLLHPKEYLQSIGFHMSNDSMTVW